MNTSYQRASGYRTEEVSLRPRGNTVTVDVPSDNPFEDELAGAPVTVTTQASGGVAKAPARQQSRKITYQGPRQGAPVAGIKRALVQAKTRRENGGFIPGLSGTDAEYRAFLLRRAGLGSLDRRPTFAVAPRKQDPKGGFMPGMGDADDLGAVSESEYQAAKITLAAPVTLNTGPARDAAQTVVNTYDAEQSAKRMETLKAGLSTGVEQASKLYTSDIERRKAATSASLEKARADAQARIANATSAAEQAKAKSDLARINADAGREAVAAGAKTTTTKWLVGGGIAVLALGVLAFVLLKPKKA